MGCRQTESIFTPSKGVGAGVYLTGGGGGGGGGWGLGSDALEGRGCTPLPGRPGYVQPLSPSRQVPASMAFVTDSNRPQPLRQPPPTACLTAAVAACEAPSNASLGLGPKTLCSKNGPTRLSQR